MYEVFFSGDQVIDGIKVRKAGFEDIKRVEPAKETVQ
jgi:hypothetical protein